MKSSTGSVGGGFGGFEKKSVRLSFNVRRRRLTFGALRGLATGDARDRGQMEKSA